MNARLRTFVLLLAAVTAVAVLAVGPAMATEGGGEGEDDGKISLPDNPRDQVGLVLIGLSGLAVLAGGINALRQLRGDRPQASGRIRWR